MCNFCLILESEHRKTEQLQIFYRQLVINLIIKTRKLGDWPLPVAGVQFWHCTKARPNLPFAAGSKGFKILQKSS
jgi:hypothetical protein